MQRRMVATIIAVAVITAISSIFVSIWLHAILLRTGLEGHFGLARSVAYSVVRYYELNKEVPPSLPSLFAFAESSSGAISPLSDETKKCITYERLSPCSCVILDFSPQTHPIAIILNFETKQWVQVWQQSGKVMRSESNVELKHPRGV